MLPDRVSNPGPLTYESDALPIALRGPALIHVHVESSWYRYFFERVYFINSANRVQRMKTRMAALVQ